MPEYNDQQIRDVIAATTEKYRKQGGTESQVVAELARIAKNNNISLDRIDAATNFDRMDIANKIFKAQDQGENIFIPGDLRFSAGADSLEGVETALNDAAARARAATTAGYSDASAQLSPYNETGGLANDALADLQGLNGPEAQALAYQNFNASPGQDFLQQQGSRAVLGNASALGGLGGGNVQKELTRFGQGLAQQNFTDFRDSLERTRSGGISAAGGIANLLGGQGRDLAGIETGLGGAIGSARLSNSQLKSDQNFQAGILDSQYRQQNLNNAIGLTGQAGSDISSQINNGANNASNMSLALSGDLQRLAELGIISIPNQMAAGGAAIAGGRNQGASDIRGTLAAIGGFL